MVNWNQINKMVDYKNLYIIGKNIYWAHNMTIVFFGVTYSKDV